MREYINNNVKIIKKHFIKRSQVLSQLNNISITAEFKEWNVGTSEKGEPIWTLPDLTNTDRYKNFCRSIKKQIK